MTGGIGCPDYERQKVLLWGIYNIYPGMLVIVQAQTPEHCLGPGAQEYGSSSASVSLPVQESLEF